jgi:hypothetical protein
MTPNQKMSAVNRHQIPLKGFSGFDLGRWNSQKKRKPPETMCHAGSLVRSSDDEDPGVWSSEEENSTRTTCKSFTMFLSEVVCAPTLCERCYQKDHDVD